jgi:uncharacterized repeat protein (TIGR01451 family)
MSIAYDSSLRKPNQGKEMFTLNTARVTGVLLLLSSLGVLPAAMAQTIVASNNQICAGAPQRTNGGTNCTANDFTSSATVTNSTGATSCVHGSTFTADLAFNITHSSPNTRYNVAILVGEQGNNPMLTTSGNVCSVVTMPNNIVPWSEADTPADSCGDATGSFSNQLVTMQGVTLSCSGTPGGNPQVYYAIAWDQNSGHPCTGASDVQVHSPKCNNNSGASIPITGMTITAAADLSIVKNVAITGNTVTYTMVITNSGPDAANGASYSDAVPNTVSITGATCGTPTGGALCGTQPNVSGQNVTGTVGTLPNGGSVTITVTGTAANNAVVDNTASVAPPANVADPNNGNNSSTATGTVGAASADVGIQKSVSFSGNTVTYTLLITNFGPATADGATYSDAVPATVSGINATCGTPAGGAACATPNVSGQNVTGTVPTLPSGGSVTITITGTAANGANVDNTANVAPPSGTNDPSNGNNSSTATGNVPLPSADLSVVKNVAINTGVVPAAVTYTLVISNAGPAAADGASYTDNVPATVTVGTPTCGSETGGAVCATQPSVTGQTVSGTIGTLPAGGTATITIPGTAANNAVVDNTASVAPPAGTNDPNNGDNSSTATGTVGGPTANVAMQKSVVITGNTVTYTLLISNAGPNAANLASYTDNVPATVAIGTPTCGSPTGGAACGTQPNVSGQTVSGTVGTLPNGGSVTITIPGTAANGAVVDNTASVAPPSGTTDPSSGNNSDTATGTVGSSADLNMAKSVVISGNNVTYTLVITNNGGNAADGATYSDAVPATVTLTGTPTCAVTTGSPACGSVNVAGNTVSGSVTTFPANSSVTITISGTTTNGADVSNSATVVPPAGTTDPNPSDNTDTATGTGLPVRLQSFDVK